MSPQPEMTEKDFFSCSHEPKITFWTIKQIKNNSNSTMSVWGLE